MTYPTTRIFFGSEVHDEDWQEAACPVCGHTQDEHSDAQLTHCAQIAYNVQGGQT